VGPRFGRDAIVVVADGGGTSSVLVFPVTGENAGEAFRHPFRCAP